MTELTRRNLVLSATLAGVVFGAGRPLEIVSPALAQSGSGPSPLNPKGAKFHRFNVGSIEVTQVFDGASDRDHSPTFIKNATVDETKAALRAGGLPDDKVPNAFTVTIVRLGDRIVMFDAGNARGASPNVGLLAENMKEAGLDPAKLSAIIVTHFHPDHIFGLMTKENAQLYPDTEIIVSETEYKYWTDPATLASLPEARQGLAKRIQATLPGWKNIRRHAGQGDVVPGIRAIDTFGHTPGHTSYHLESGGQQLIVLGDVTNIPALTVRNPGWHIFFDQDPQMAEASRRRIFDRAAADKVMLTGYHWGMPGAGIVSADGGGYVLAPVAV